MPLIKNKLPQTKTNLRGKEISTDVYHQIEKYCEWAGIDDMAIFLEEAALHVFKSDKDWKAQQKKQVSKTADEI